MGNVIHKTVPIKVWVDVDEGVFRIVQTINSIAGARTYSCCQGTIGEGGAKPYTAFISVGWSDDSVRTEIAKHGRLVEEGNGHGILYPAR